MSSKHTPYSTNRKTILARNNELAAIKETQSYALQHSNTDKSVGIKFKIEDYFKFDNGHYNV